jgi:hypothetical protein
MSLPGLAYASTTAPPDAAAKSACAKVRALTEKGTPPSIKGLASPLRVLSSSKSSGAKTIIRFLKASGKQSVRNRALKRAAKWCHDNGAWLTQLERAQVNYALIVGPLNSAVDDYNKRARSMTFQQSCVVLAPLIDKYARDLQAYTDWPKDVQAQVVAAETASAAEAGLYYQCSHDPASTTQAALNDAQNKSAAAISALRFALHLPINR